MTGYALVLTAEAHYHAHDAERALACARQLEEISRALGEPPILVVYAEFAYASAHLAAGRIADAIEAARRGMRKESAVSCQRSAVSRTTHEPAVNRPASILLMSKVE